MRVVEPSAFGQNNQPKNSRNSALIKSLAFVLIFFSVIGAIYVFASREVASPTVEVAVIPDTPAAELAQDEPKSFDEFTDDEFRLFYDNLLQPKTELVSLPPSITGNELADTRIKQIAEKRGYKLRSVSTINPPFIEGLQLHQEVHQPWRDLRATLAQSGYTVSITSAYRTVEEQRRLFLERLTQENVTLQQIADGLADEAIGEVLLEAAPPGYSKHHTGYTVDLLCAGYAFRNFINSPCHDELVADNYKLARAYGFLPSYPAEANLQGPEPEAWEYVWVGDVIM